MWRHRVKPKHDSRKQILLTWLNELNTAGMIGTDDPLTNSQCACALGLLHSSTKKSWAYYQICCLTILTEMWYVAWASLTGMHWTHNTNISKETGEKNVTHYIPSHKNDALMFHIFPCSIAFFYLFLIISHLLYTYLFLSKNRSFPCPCESAHLQVGLQHRIDTNGRRPSELTDLGAYRSVFHRTEGMGPMGSYNIW